MGRTPASTTEQGAAGESLAWEMLAQQGYRLVHRNFRAVGGELNLIAYEGDVLCFIEVRTRATAAWGHPLETVDRAKQARIARSAAAYLQQHPTASPCRFDVVAIVLGPTIQDRAITLVREAFVPTYIGAG
jgi:putative endonuclease